MKNKSFILIVTLIAIAAMLVSGGPVFAADGWHGGHGSRGWNSGGHGWNGGHGWHGGGGYWRGGWGWGWPWFGFGLATGAILGYPYYSQTYPYYPYYPAYDAYGYGYAPAYRYSPRVIYREREYEPYQEYESARDYEPARTRPSATSADSRSYWYLCKESNAYYPYVRQCAGGWERIPVLPPPSGPDDDR